MEETSAKLGLEEIRQLALVQVQIACMTKHHFKFVTDATAIDLAQHLEVNRWYRMPSCSECETKNRCLIRLADAGFDGLIGELEASVFGSHVH